MLASYGELAFSLIGFLYQLGGLTFESIHLIMVQKLLNPVNATPLPGSDEEAQAREEDVKDVIVEKPNYKMDPLVSLYYHAPVCAVINIFVALVVEAPTFKYEDLAKVGVFTLIGNASVAFLLKVASEDEISDVRSIREEVASSITSPLPLLCHIAGGEQSR